MARWIVIAALLAVMLSLTAWGGVWLYHKERSPGRVVNPPVRQTEAEKVIQPGQVQPARDQRPGDAPPPGTGTKPPATQPAVAVSTPPKVVQPVVAPVAPPIVTPAVPATVEPSSLPLTYQPDATFGEKANFQQPVVALAIDQPRGLLYVVSGNQVVVFDCRTQQETGRFTIRRPALSLCVDAQGDVYAGQRGRAEKYNPKTGQRLAKIADLLVGEVTSIDVRGSEILLGDATAGRIRRFDGTKPVHDQYRQELGQIPSAKIDLIPSTQPGDAGGDPTRPRPVLTLPNRTLDFAVTPDGRLVVAHAGRMRVELYDPASRLLGKWGDYHPTDVRQFVGCCNPINVATFPLSWLGRADLADRGLGIVTAEKSIARVKLYDQAGQLLALIEPKHFSQSNTTMDLAVDSKGRIYVADTNRRLVRRFAPKPG